MSSAILAESTTGPNVTVSNNDDATVDAEDVEVKGVADVNLWDNEW